MREQSSGMMLSLPAASDYSLSQLHSDPVDVEQGSILQAPISSNVHDEHAEPGHADVSVHARHCAESLTGGRFEESNPAANGEFTSAEAAIRMLLPGCSSAVFTRMRREGVTSAEDLVGLDKDDLRMLGFSMVERSRVMRWACGDEPVGKPASPKQMRLAQDGLIVPDSNKSGVLSDMSRMDKVSSYEENVQRRLDEVEKQADFWIDLVSTAPSSSLSNRRPSGAELSDVRENMLEMLFDLTEERVREVYNGIDRDADGHISAAELGRGLLRYNLPELNDQALLKILDVVTASKSRFLQLTEFEAVLSRLKLAQVLQGTEQTPAGKQLGSMRRLTVADYSAASTTANVMEVTRPREFFFGHRPHDKLGTLVRWVHLGGLDLTMLLALTVKYSLHPLSVEDVLEQSPTKIDRNGRNYFVAIEHLGLASAAPDGSEPVRVRGRHVAVFCAGPPRLDTMLTVVQPDKSFEEEWPGGVSYFDVMDTGDRWVDRLQERLKAPLSRLRERLCDFLLYQVIDLCTDDLMSVSKAYTKRLGQLELELHSKGSSLPQDWPSEVSLARLQLAVFSRRVRGLQRVIRHIIHDSDLSAGLLSYFQDVADHLHEAHDDAGQLAERCSAIAETYERTLERGQERVQQLTAERLNRTLFVLTTFTTVFTPMQFIAGVYGMNFVDSKGKPTIPELNVTHGYRYFWGGVVLYMVISLSMAWCLFRRLQRNEARAKGQCHGPLYLCGNSHLCGGGVNAKRFDRDLS